VAKRDTSEQIRRFGPMSGLLIAAAIAFIVLPSTLTLPNPSPTSQEEIAPVPPTDSKLNPPVSNFTNLNSGNTGTGLGNGGGGGNLPPDGPVKLPPVGIGKTPPSTYECVAGRQTEDRLSPTCVPFFNGQNGGATFQGVTAKEVRILIYFDPYGTLNTSQGRSDPPYNTIIDLDDAPKANEHPAVYTNRAWATFFNKRYATYDRRVHTFVQFGSYDSSAEQTPGTQAQDAALAYAKVKPFAVINYAAFGNGAYFNNYMAEHSVLNFGSVAGRSDTFYRQYPGLQWGYPPTLEYAAAQYAQFVCNVIHKKPAQDLGQGVNTPAAGGERKYGFLYTTDKAYEGVQQQAELSFALMKQQCGLEPTAVQTYDHNGYSVDNQRTPDYALNIAVDFAGKDVTTVLWPAGYEQKISGAFNDSNYFPEIILGDEDQMASNYGSFFQDKNAWSHAWIMTHQTYDPPPNDRICAQEYRTVDQNSANSDVQNFACDFYNDLRQLYTGIQVSGPNLTPKSLDQGMHAIPIVESTDPELPTCYYLANDYTCVKDSTIEHWDPAAQTESSRNPGCWRMVDNGKRYLPGKFPKDRNLLAMKKPNHICNNFSQSVLLALA
jgi:hypothetical protein